MVASYKDNNKEIGEGLNPKDDGREGKLREVNEVGKRIGFEDDSGISKTLKMSFDKRNNDGGRGDNARKNCDLRQVEGNRQQEHFVRHEDGITKKGFDRQDGIRVKKGFNHWKGDITTDQD